MNSRKREDRNVVAAWWKEKNRTNTRKKDLYNKKREIFYNGNRWEAAIKKLISKDKDIEGIVKQREEDIQLIDNKIVKRYNIRYKIIEMRNSDALDAQNTLKKKD